jgi:ERCC4-related helicase
MEMKMHYSYRQLAREYHLDKNNHEVTGLTAAEASECDGSMEPTCEFETTAEYVRAPP